MESPRISMYSFLLALHSFNRWSVLFFLAISLGYSLFALGRNRENPRIARILISVPTIFIHIQLVLGMVLYFKSPVVRAFFSALGKNLSVPELSFFAIFHSVTMIFSVILATIGSAKAKREKDFVERYRIVIAWFGSALLCILVAIPWPAFSVVVRPLFRPF